MPFRHSASGFSCIGIYFKLTSITDDHDADTRDHKAGNYSAFCMISY